MSVPDIIRTGFQRSLEKVKTGVNPISDKFVGVQGIIYLILFLFFNFIQIVMNRIITLLYKVRTINL